MPRWITRIFHRQPVAEILRDQLFEAERMHALHLAAAEHHAVLAGMYQGRAERIRKQQAGGNALRAVK